MKRIFLIVLDSFGVGAEPDAADFGDVGSNTLRSCASSKLFAMPNLIAAGFGNLDGVDFLPKAEHPTAAIARLQELSRGKDTTIGHWEISGIVSPQPFSTSIFLASSRSSIVSSRFSAFTDSGSICFTMANARFILVIQSLSPRGLYPSAVLYSSSAPW